MLGDSLVYENHFTMIKNIMYPNILDKNIIYGIKTQNIFKYYLLIIKFTPFKTTPNLKYYLKTFMIRLK